MQCEHCQQNPARVRVDPLVNGRRVSYFLCQSCVDSKIVEKGKKQAKGMQCERCQQGSARVRFDDLVGGRRASYFYCQSCVDEVVSIMG
jgi:protein-arginine kinase activator protein McsA